MASLLAMLDTKLDAARRLRLARDTWAVRVEALRRYRAAIAEPLSLLRLSRESLDRNPPPGRPVARAAARRLATRTARAMTLLAPIVVPGRGRRRRTAC